MAEHDPATIMVDILYTSGPRVGERYGVSLGEAMTNHPDAVITSYANGQAFTDDAAEHNVRAVKAASRDARAEKRAADRAARAEAAAGESPAVATVAEG